MTRVFTPLIVPAAGVPLVVILTPLPTPANDDLKAPSETHGVLPVLDVRKSAEKSATAAKTHAYEHTTDLGKLTSAYRCAEADATARAVAHTTPRTIRVIMIISP